MAQTKQGAIVLGIEGNSKKRRLVGRVFSSDGKTLRHGSVEGSGDVSIGKLQALAAYLDGEEAAFGVRVEMAGAVAAPFARSDAAPFRFGNWKWVVFGMGAVSGALGIVQLRMHGKGTCEVDPPREQCPRVYDTRNSGIVLLAAGGMAVAATTLAWLYDRRRSRKKSRAVTVVPSQGGGLSVVLRGEF